MVFSAFIKSGPIATDFIAITSYAGVPELSDPHLDYTSDN